MGTSLKNMTKAQLEEYGRSLGIELDKRLKKSAIVSQIQEFLEAPQTIESIETRPDRVHSIETPSSDIQAFMDSLPDYDGSNSGQISSIIMRSIGNIGSGKKCTWGPVGDEYHITIDNKTYKL